MNKNIKQKIIDLLDSSKVSYLGSVDEDGYPNIKAMMNIQRDGLFVHYYSTFLYSARTAQYTQNPKSCIYMSTTEDPKGLMLIGEMRVLTDPYHKELFWRDGFEVYYPDGPETENYCVLKFTASRGNFNYDGVRIDFCTDEFEQI
jgi:general stress protein 26